jgi:hypothetical protein
MQRDPKYVLRRATKVLEAQGACLSVELHRRLGEVGQPRLDPRLVDHVVQSEAAKQDGKIKEVVQSNLVFYSLSSTSPVEAQYIAEHKSLLYEKASRLKDAPENLNAVSSMIVLAAEQASSHDAGVRVMAAPAHLPGPRSLVLSGACGRERMPFAVFVSNELAWIYPYSQEVWVGLGHCCADEVALPVLIGRQFHPSCFGLFRALGMLGHATYKVYFCPAVWPDFERVKVILGFPVAATEPLDQRLSSFFEKTLPSQIERALANLPEVCDLVSEFASHGGLAQPELDPRRRLGVYEAFLSRLPSTVAVRRLRDDVAVAPWLP